MFAHFNNALTKRDRAKTEKMAILDQLAPLVLVVTLAKTELLEPKARLVLPALTANAVLLVLLALVASR